MNKFKQFLKMVAFLLPYVFSSNLGYYLLNILISITHGVSYVFVTLSLQRFLELIEVVSGGEGTSKALYFSFGIFFVALLLSQVLSGLHNVIAEDVSNVILGDMGKRFHHKAGRLEAIHYEDPHFLDTIKRAEEGVQSSVQLLFTLTSLASFYVPYFLFMMVYLYQQSPVLSFAIVLIFIPVAVSQVFKMHAYTQFSDIQGTLKRQVHAYKDCMNSRRGFKESRVLGITPYLLEKFTTATSAYSLEALKAEKQSIKVEWIGKSATLMGYTFVVLLVYSQYKNAMISAGAVGAIFASVGRMVTLMEEIISGHIGRVTRRIGSAYNFMNFMMLKKEAESDENKSDDGGIQLKNVSFSYPSSNHLAIKNLSIAIRKGERIAIVGENGSGKSTLSMLMLGLFKPTKGEALTMGGFGEVSALFQDFQKYQLSVKDNIEISSGMIGERDGDVWAQLKEIGMDEIIHGLSEKEYTLLSKEFGGAELSGGEWQRIAIARAFQKNANLIVLDEPTAAIDPIQEEQVYEIFRERTKDKTTIIVTHRLACTKWVDRIAVLKSGRLVELGNHDELIKANGTYAALYATQKKQYVTVHTQ